MPQPDTMARHWLGLVSCLHGAGSPRCDLRPCGSRFQHRDGRHSLPPGMPGTDQKAIRRGHLHHHLPGTGGLHFHPPAQRARTAHRRGSVRPSTAPRVMLCSPEGNVVPMPGGPIDQAAPAPAADVSPAERWKGITEPGTPLAAGLDAIVDQDLSFDPRHFITGAKGAYEMIVLAFAKGDRRSLKDLLSSEVLRPLRRRHQGPREERAEDRDPFRLHRQGRTRRRRSARSRSQLTVRFVSQMISVTRDKTGAVVDGSPTRSATSPTSGPLPAT